MGLDANWQTNDLTAYIATTLISEYGDSRWVLDDDPRSGTFNHPMLETPGGWFDPINYFVLTLQATGLSQDPDGTSRDANCLQNFAIWNRLKGIQVVTVEEDPIEVDRFEDREIGISFDDETAHWKSETVDALVEALSARPEVEHVFRSDRELVLLTSDLTVDEVKVLVDELYVDTETED